MFHAWRTNRPRAVFFVAATFIAGCHTTALPSTMVTFDGGVENLALPEALPGNVLPLDGGVPVGELVFKILDHDSGRPMPARVIFRPPPGGGFADSLAPGAKLDLNSAGSGAGAVVGPGVVGSPEGVLLQTGEGRVPVPPGSYDLFITRGPEWEAIETKVHVHAGQEQPVNATLERSVDTRGWLASDLHVHMKTSFDSKVPADRRIISMVTSGIELIVTTDHHTIVDVSPLVRELGYGPEMAAALSGDELNFAEGHAGVYPVPYDATKPFGGSPPWQPYNNLPTLCDAPKLGSNCFHDVEAFPMFHSTFPGAVVTVNHPFWSGGDLGYFTNIEWGAGTRHGLPRTLPSAGTFDALEILNGYWTREDAEAALLSDWFYLLSEGHRVAALGSSDTHRINWVRAGFPRTWLRLPSDRPGEITPDDFADAIRNGRAIASTGPFATLTVDGGQIGDLVRPNKRGQVEVEAVVDAPGWMHVDQVVLYVNGVAAHKWLIKPGSTARPVFGARLTVPVTSDSWFVLLASGSEPMPPDVVGEYAHESGFAMKPWAVTNPVFVDTNGDGWHPAHTWHGAPMAMPDVPSPAFPTRPRDASLRAPVPVDCDPTAERPLDHEPPLNAMQQMLPLLYP